MSEADDRMARLEGEVRAHQQALEALATTVQRIGARLDELLAERGALDDGETLTVTDEDGDSLTLTRAQWRLVAGSPRGGNLYVGEMFWTGRYSVPERACVSIRGHEPVWVDRDAIRQWVETGVYPEPDGEGRAAPEREYERRMGQPTQPPDQLVAVRPDLREVADRLRDKAHPELDVVRGQREVLRRVATALGVPVVVRDLHGAIVRHAEDVAKRARVAEAAAKDLGERLERRRRKLTEAREALRDACEAHSDEIERLRQERDREVARVREAVGEAWVRATEGDLAKAIEMKVAALEKDGEQLDRVRDALDAGQWARAMEAAGCGEEADRG